MEQLSGCRIPGCQCDRRVAVMEWGSDDMTETDDSEYEGSIDRANRLYVESYNYDLSEGMTPKTYNPPLRRNRRRRYEVRKKNEVEVKESIIVTSDRVFQADKESPKLEPTVQPRTVADDDIPKSRDKTVDRGRGTRTGSDKDISICSTDRSRSRRRHGIVGILRVQVIRNIGTTSTARRKKR